MTEEQINCLARYLGCECTYFILFMSNQSESKFDIDSLRALISGEYSTKSFHLRLNPLSSLTTEDCGKMDYDYKFGVYGEYSTKKKEGIRDRVLKGLEFQSATGGIDHRQADWLRNNGYYLGEELIKEFVKLKK